MNKARCWSCGLVNFTTTDNCRRCGKALGEPQAAPHYPQIPVTPQPAQPVNKDGGGASDAWLQRLSHPPRHSDSSAGLPRPASHQPPPVSGYTALPNHSGRAIGTAPVQTTNSYMPLVPPRPGKSFTHYLRIVAVVVGALIVAYIRFQSFFPTPPHKEEPKYSPVQYLKFSSENPYSDTTLRENLMTYIMHPHLFYAEFGGRTLAQKLFKDAWVEDYDSESRMVYFGLDKSKVTSDRLPLYISDFIVTQSTVEYATNDGQEVKLNGYTADRIKFASAYLFRTPLSNLRVDMNQMLSFNTYQISMREMADFMAGKNIYGGNPEIRCGNDLKTAPLLLGNHGAFVAKPHEPSLQRFINKYLSRFPGVDLAGREARIQLLLDFVSENIEYDDKEGRSAKEWLKRPNETLISGRGDCSNKSILFASLLEQLGEDYLLVYLPHHITVAVRQGRFSTANGLSFMWEGETWVIAETTASGFQIGEDSVENADKLKHIEYIQRPSQPGTLYNYATRQRMTFN